ncbi:Exostosin family protein [Hibiscus syriacus]|uniref:Exostosin family protein n=1 Tax=Hibiscus syriacus TaxID=106335 RepID=A0A6A2YKG2_HIBSY|nr:Exostosin family protein [Hibiscus syriacus]
MQNNFTKSGDDSSVPKAPMTKKKPEMPPALTTIADMNNLFHMNPWSYELMESTVKVYVYKEGKKLIFHMPVLGNIYGSEGWFMKQLKTNKKFDTENPGEAHLFYLPFSSRMLKKTLYNYHRLKNLKKNLKNYVGTIAAKFVTKNPRDADFPSSSRMLNKTLDDYEPESPKNLIQYLKNYVDKIAAKYPFWNRTEGADRFMVACHDWAPSETREPMANCIRSLCNADVKEGYIFGKDVSLPETYVRNPQKPLEDLVGKQRSQHENFGKMPNVKGKMNYVQHLKRCKYCLCLRGYEVNSPRVVEAIFYECVPVIISDNFVPPFFEVLNWESFAVFILEKDIPNMKKILLSIPEEQYLQMQMSVKKV